MFSIFRSKGRVLMSDVGVQFHYECVGILKAPPSNVNWYCPDCAVTQPPKKKRKR